MFCYCQGCYSGEPHFFGVVPSMSVSASRKLCGMKQSLVTLKRKSWVSFCLQVRELAT